MSEPPLPPAATGEAPRPDPWAELRRHTPARIALGRAGTSLPTHELLRFAAAHAQARDAVQLPLDVPALEAALRADGHAPVVVRSRAASREEYLRRPDLGRRLAEADAARLAPADPPPELCVVVGDGLSARATQAHAAAVLRALRAALDGALRVAEPVIATGARVALADEVGERLGAACVLILLGERPGLSSPDSLGAYLTFAPRLGRVDAERNCVSNIRPEGLPPAAAGARLAWLVREALRRRLSGTALKDESATVLLPG